MKFEIVNTQSNIDWIGRKVTGEHNGTIGIKQGWLEFTDEKLTGGTFVIDTTSIKILDVTDPATNAQFAGHLASDDFFSSEKYPEAVFEITSVNKGNLSIKGITRPLSFEAEIIRNGNNLRASCKIIIDRTEFDMKFRSGNFFQNLGDTLIYNDIDLNVNIYAIRKN
jgi:hypothetical protein